ncbi:unnamed protein product [Ilex paraguariensis]|uniref:non-specific serine/threonine protein kinase n=1 Tax=Ilex paraguariensis TaxID=185542 RepID=A0ABC8SBR1_9AQUA
MQDPADRDLSTNHLTGPTPVNGSFQLFTSISFATTFRFSTTIIFFFSLMYGSIQFTPPRSTGFSCNQHREKQVYKRRSNGSTLYRSVSHNHVVKNAVNYLLNCTVSLLLLHHVLDQMRTSSLGNSATRAIAGGVAAGSALLFAAPAMALALWRRRKPEDHFFDVPAEEDPEVHLGQLKRFSLRELQVASDNFSNKNIIGRGGFGKVYKGRLADGSLVAIKRQKEGRTQGGELEFQTEVEMASMALHRNLLRLRGFCMTPTERVLVYPFMVNGSVASCLRERGESQPPLVWPIRKRIALVAARGLAYLHDHCDPKIIHGDVKAANILLDEEFEAVVGDFGLAKLVDYNDTHVTTAVRNTIGHIAPEYLSTGEYSEKTDVFGYGFTLLELISGQRAFDLARLANDDDVMLLDWVTGLLKKKKLVTLVDADLQGNYVDEEVEELIQVALLCTQTSPMQRPKMSDVVRMLEGDGLAERWEEWEKEEVFREEVNHTHHPNTDWIIADSTSNLSPDELSGPR